MFCRLFIDETWYIKSEEQFKTFAEISLLILSVCNLKTKSTSDLIVEN